MARRTDWGDTLIGLTIPTGLQADVETDGGSTKVVQRGTTVVRTLIMLDFLSTTVAGAWGVQLVDAAIGLISREAFTAGIRPDPNDDEDEPSLGWMWRIRKVVTQNGTGTPVAVRVEADIRSARKIEAGKLFLVVNNTAQAGTSFSVLTSGLIRTLIKLP